MSTWTGPWRVVGANHSHVYSVQNIVSGKVHTAYVARLRFYADADLNITAEIRDVFQHSYAQGECQMNALMHVAEDYQGDVIVFVDWEGFDAENARGSLFVRFILLRLISCWRNSVWNFFVIACDFVLVFVWLSSSFVLRLNKLWGCCSQKKVPSRRVSV